MTTRRDFLRTSAALLVAPQALGTSAAPFGRLPIGFSTLGCPGWDWRQILDFAAAHGYVSIELRGLQTTMDIPEHPVFAPARLHQPKRELAERGLTVSCLGSSAHLHEMDPAKHAAQLDEAPRFTGLAQAPGAPYVRVFGNNYVDGVSREAMRAKIASGLRELGAYALERGVTVLVESHGDFTDSPAPLEILERADSPAAGLLWDAHHTFAYGGEAPEDTARQLGRWIRHTHLKDSIPAGADRRYVLTGRGEVPIRAQIEALARSGYRGYYSFEWEKRWHPEIEEPEVAIAQFATVVSERLRAAGVPEVP